MIERDHFTPPFSPVDVKPWRCPVCPGALAPVKDSLRIEHTAQDKRDKDHPDWEPDWERARFSMLLRCSRCEEPVFVVGKTEVVEIYDHDYDHGLETTIVPAYFEPSIPIITIPKSCPDEVRAEITHATSLYWSSPASAGNRIRVAVERLMDHLGVPRKAKNKSGRYGELKLHHRIERFTLKHQDVGEKLIAIKSLGNTASHSDVLTQSDVLDSLDLLEDALAEIFDKRSKTLKKLASAITKKNKRHK